MIYKKMLTLFTASAIISILALDAFAQFTITFPKLPKINRSKSETSKEPQGVAVRPQSHESNEPRSKQSSMQDKCTQSGWLERHLAEIAKRQNEVSTYTPDRGWFTKDFTYDHVLNAVSPSAREKWLKDSNGLQFKDCQNLVSAFDKLATTAAAKFPIYTPNPNFYKFRNAAEEKLMKTSLKNAATVKIHKIGLNQAA